MPLNPALAAFEAAVSNQLPWGQVCILREGSRFELRHVSDGAASVESLRSVRITDLRQIAGTNASGQFRPLKSQPDLPSGWRVLCQGADELGRALDHLYPGSIADWYAVQIAPVAPTTDFRAFTGQQTGMYRITQMLIYGQAAFVIRAGCHVRNCLKRRIWSVEGLAPDTAESKSAIPCLEPCAVLLEFARKSMRIEQEERLGVQLQQSEAETVLAALDSLVASDRELAAVGDFGSPLNPRRVQLVLEKFRTQVDLSRQSTAQE